MIGLIIGAVVLSLVAAGVMRYRGAGEDAAGRPLLGGRGEQVALIHVEGAITSSRGAGAGAARSERIVSLLRTAEKDRSIRAVVLRINSPGGSAAASQEIGEAVKRLRKAGKPVVASMGDVAASGGYWIAANTDRIVANPGTVTGSIGVIFQVFNAQGLGDKVGVRSEVFKSGEHKDIGSPARAVTETERAILQGMVTDIYGQFVEVVAEGRNLPVERVRRLADGRIFTGRQARDAGLVDELGGLEDAVRLAGRMANVEGDPTVRELDRRSPFEDLFPTPGIDALWAITQRLLAVPGRFDGALDAVGVHGQLPTAR